MYALRNLSIGKRIHLLSGAVVLLFLLVIGWLLCEFRSHLHQSRRLEIRHLVESTSQILEFRWRQVSDGVFSADEARQRALEGTRNHRFEQENYFWAMDLSGTMLAHPASPNLEGRDLTDFKDPAGKALFAEMLEKVESEGEGFVEYLYPRPGGSIPESKVAFVQEVPGWGWMIGAGYYVRDVDAVVFRHALLVGAVIFLVLIGALLLVNQMSRSISRPMARAVTMLEALERGDLGHRLHLDQHDEIGRLANALDRFADNLQHEILTAFDHLARGDFSFKAKGLIREPLAQTNVRLNALVARLDSTVVEALEERTRSEALIAAIGEGVAIYDSELRFTYQNRAHADIAGDKVGKSCSLAYTGGNHDCSECALARSKTDGEVHRMERVIATEECPSYLEVTAAPVRDAEGEIVSIIEIARDVTARKQSETALAESEMRYFDFFRDNRAVMLVLDPESASIVDANQAAFDFYGYGPEKLIGMRLEEINTAPRKELLRLVEISRTEGLRQFQTQHRLASEELRHVEIHSGPVRMQGQEMLYAIVQDATDRKRAEEQVEFLAFHDPLTGLPNRALLEDRLGRKLTRIDSVRSQGALLSIDLDRFNRINKSLGHHGGDLLLEEVAVRLQKLLRPIDTLSRSPGDEFMMLLPELNGPADAAHIADEILQEFTQSFRILEEDVFITPSIGISFYPADGNDSGNLIRNAETAMYAAKKAGRNTFRFFKSELMGTARERLELENHLRRALENRELTLHYQPQFDARTGALIGVEALARWHHAQKGWISPSEFIPLAEECGLIEKLGAWALKEACTQNMRWQREGHLPLRMAVNVSGQQFRQPDFIDILDWILEETGLDPCWLELEVTENLIMEDVEETITTLHKLKSRNISLAVDDFGTGYSSLSYLRQFPIDRLKIDRSFVAQVTSSVDDAAIASAIINLARTLHLEVVAEGVETAEQARFLTRRHCNVMQGYHFGRPAPPEEISSLLEQEEDCLADSAREARTTG